MSKRVALLLSGCGVMDGSEIQESVYALLALSQAGASVEYCAPNFDQAHVINHAAGQPSQETRNILVEAARIARGKISDLATIKAANFDAIILPGGYGAAKNLCSYAFDGRDANPHPEVARVLHEFHQQGKAIGAICIAPMVVASTFKGTPVAPSLTIGSEAGTAADLESFGSHHVNCGVTEIALDEKNRIVSTPAYMYQAAPSEVYEGVRKLVDKVLALCR